MCFLSPLLQVSWITVYDACLRPHFLPIVFHFHFWWFNLILLVLQHFHSSCVGPSETPKVCCSCPRPSHVESGLQNQTNWWWLWWKRDKVSLSGCCGFCPVISPEPTCQTNIRQGCWYDDNWAAPQLSWKVQGTNYLFIFYLDYWREKCSLEVFQMRSMIIISLRRTVSLSIET